MAFEHLSSLFINPKPLSWSNSGLVQCMTVVQTRTSRKNKETEKIIKRKEKAASSAGSACNTDKGPEPKVSA